MVVRVRVPSTSKKAATDVGTVGALSRTWSRLLRPVLSGTGGSAGSSSLPGPGRLHDGFAGGGAGAAASTGRKRGGRGTAPAPLPSGSSSGSTPPRRPTPAGGGARRSKPRSRRPRGGQQVLGAETARRALTGEIDGRCGAGTGRDGQLQVPGIGRLRPLDSRPRTSNPDVQPLAFGADERHHRRPASPAAAQLLAQLFLGPDDCLRVPPRVSREGREVNELPFASL